MAETKHEKNQYKQLKASKTTNIWEHIAIRSWGTVRKYE